MASGGVGRSRVGWVEWPLVVCLWVCSVRLWAFVFGACCLLSVVCCLLSVVLGVSQVSLFTPRSTTQWTNCTPRTRPT